jgi:hypothetical protein
VIILGIIVLVVLYITVQSIRADSWEWGLKIAGSILAVVMLVFLTTMAMTGIVTVTTNLEERKDQWSFNIQAAADGSLTNGSFFIFGGQIEEEPMYFFYREDNGVIRQGHIPVANTVIIEDQESRGFIKVTTQSTEMVVDPLYVYVPFGGEKEYEIHVPKGSVVRQFNFDLEK